MLRFNIDAGGLSDALLDFSRQSNTPIVFSDRLTRNRQSLPLVGSLTSAQALDQLLQDSGLSWKLIDKSVIAVYERRCDETASSGEQLCPSATATARALPVYQPGLEETYVYGNRVTGSRIRRSSSADTGPVAIIQAPAIAASGAQTIGELLKFIPAVSGNATSTAISNGGDGTATVTLRGLPASNTLVLINGYRVANDGLAGESVDLNSIPPSAVERIEILKDSASAIYGSDAIAGVVNVILKRDFYGLQVNTFHGQTERGDLPTNTQTLQYGRAINNGSFLISGSSYRQGSIYSRDREVSQSADTRAMGGDDQRSSATSDARIRFPNGDTVIADDDGYRPATEEDLFNYQAYTTAVVPLQRQSLYANLSYDLADQVTSLLEVSHMQTEATATLAPTPVFSAFERQPLTVAVDNPYNSFGTELGDVRRRLLELGPRRQINESQVSRFTAAIEGLYADWNWSLAYNWSNSRARERVTNIVDADKLARGLGPATRCQGAAIDGCVPINLIGPAGSLDGEQADYIRTQGNVEGYYKLSSIAVNFSNALLNMPYGRGDLAFGLEFRQEATSKRPDTLLAEAATIGASNFEATRGDRKIAEFYLETVLPLWHSADRHQLVELDAALRQSQYSDFGSSTDPKLSLNIQLLPGLQLRGSYAEGFRAPSLNELYEGSSEVQAFINDPCAQAANVGTLVGCSQMADPSRNQFLTIKGGNPELEAEKAQSYGAGITWAPIQWPGLRATVDYFQIEQRDVVASSAQFIVDQNARNGDFAANVMRDAQGNLLRVDASNINVGRRRIRGTDIGLSYHYPQRHWGQLSLTGSATYIDQFLAATDSSSREVDFAGSFRDEASEGLGGIPQWKAQLGLRWTRGRWQGNYEMHYVGSMREQLADNSRRNIAAWTVHDLQLAYRFDVLKGLRWTLGVDNVLDEEAPLAASAFNDNIDGRSHELKGRYWYTGLSQRF